MRRKGMPLLGRVPGSAQFAAGAIALIVGACGGRSADFGAGRGGADAGGGMSGAALGGATSAGRSPDDGDAGTPEDGRSGAAGRATAGAAGRLSHGGGAGAAAGSGAVGSSTAGEAGAGGEPGREMLGQSCGSDANCGKGLICLQPSSNELSGGGPASGLCTARCDNSAACEELEAGAGCFSFGTEAYCLQPCTPGSPLAPFSKCHGRQDVTCFPVDDTQAFCTPRCRLDADCGGRYCNRASGMCQQSKPVGDPVGAPCDPSATAAATCLGTCLRTSDYGATPVTGACVELCSGGQACMYSDAGAHTGGFCAGPLGDPFGESDLGYCLPTCDCSSDCPTFADKCRAWTRDDAALADFLDTPGICFANTEGSAPLTCQ